MLISFLFLIILYNLIRTTHSIERKYFSLLVIIIYVFFSMWDYYWLINVDNYPFHPSDPSDYYTETKGLSLKQVLGIESSNQLYFVINWYYNSLWYNPYFISFLVNPIGIFSIVIFCALKSSIFTISGNISIFSAVVSLCFFTFSISSFMNTLYSSGSQTFAV